MKKESNEIMDMAFNKAKQYEMQSGGCSQCTLSGIFDALDVQNDEIIKAATGLVDGVSLTGDGHCGSLSGGVLAIGYIFGRKKRVQRYDEVAKSEFTLKKSCMIVS